MIQASGYLAQCRLSLSVGRMCSYDDNWLVCLYVCSQFGFENISETAKREIKIDH